MAWFNWFIPAQELVQNCLIISHLQDYLPSSDPVTIIGGAISFGGLLFSFFKNNLALLVPPIIALVAILLFIPTFLLSGRLRASMEKQSVQVSRQIDSLVKDVAEAAEAEAMESYMDAYRQDADAMDKLILQSTQRELLSYKLFPDMNESSPLLFEPFRQGFVSGVDAMLKRLGAGSPPTDNDIITALDNSPSRSQFARRARTTLPSAGSAYGGSGGRRLNLRMLSEVDKKIVTKVCEDKARTAHLYASPVDVGGYLYWSDWKYDGWDKAVKDCWYWQMAYWALEDVATTIERMNKDAENVMQSSVKRIISVLFTQSRSSRSMIGSRGYRRGGVATSRDKQTPTYVMTVKTSMTGTPCTGRFCDETLDVMQFEVRVVLNSADVMRFMQELCSSKPHKFRGWRGDEPEQTLKHNQITILEMQVVPVDREDPEHGTYEYGPEEVVDVDLICEYAFNKAAYEKIKPAAVLKDLEDAKAPAKR